MMPSVDLTRDPLLILGCERRPARIQETLRKAAKGDTVKGDTRRKETRRRTESHCESGGELRLCSASELARALKAAPSSAMKREARCLATHRGPIQDSPMNCSTFRDVTRRREEN